MLRLLKGKTENVNGSKITLKKLIADNIDDLAQVEDNVFERAKSLLNEDELESFVDLIEKYELFKNVAQRKSQSIFCPFT